MVYLAEAHASDVWQMPSNVKDDVVIETPGSLDERRAVARSCITRLSIELPAVVDEYDDRTEIAYTAWPDRLYVIDRDGNVSAKSTPGPFGFDVGLVATELARLVPNPSPPTPGEGLPALRQELEQATVPPNGPGA